MRKRIEELIWEGMAPEAGDSLLDRLAKRAISYLVTMILEDELTDWLGRGHYDRGNIWFTNMPQLITGLFTR